MIDFELLENDISCLISELDYKRISSVDESDSFGSSKGNTKRFYISSPSSSSLNIQNANGATVSNTITIFYSHGDDFAKQQKAKFQVMNDIFKIGEKMKEKNLKKDFKCASLYIMTIANLSSSSLKLNTGYISIDFEIQSRISITNRS